MTAMHTRNLICLIGTIFVCAHCANASSVVVRHGVDSESNPAPIQPHTTPEREAQIWDAQNRAKLIKSAEENRVGSAVLGWNGELFLTPPGEYWHFGAADAWVLPVNGGLAITGFAGADLKPFITIDATLVIRATEFCPAEFASRFTSGTWPEKTAEGEPGGIRGVHMMLPRNYSKKELRAWRKRMPTATIGSLFLDTHGELRGLCKNAPFPNVLWAVRSDDGGLELIHSGPSRQGTYLKIAPSTEVTFADPEARPWADCRNGLKWAVVDAETGYPTIYPCNWITPSGRGPRVYVAPDGRPELRPDPLE